MEKDEYGIPFNKPWREVRFKDDDGTSMNLMDWQAKLQSEIGMGTLKLRKIVRQLRSCEFECEAGPLELNTAFIDLVNLAKLNGSDNTE